jgi:hypothetical protein
MTASTSLSRLRIASKLCVLGAWAILAMGLTLVILFYILNNVGNGPNSGPGMGFIIFVALVIAIVVFFFFIALYAIGALLNYVGTPKNTTEESVTPLKVKDIVQDGDVQLEITSIREIW